MSTLKMKFYSRKTHAEGLAALMDIYMLTFTNDVNTVKMKQRFIQTMQTFVKITFTAYTNGY